MATFRTSATGGSSTGTSNRTAVITPAVGDLFVVVCHVATNTNAAPTCSDNNGGTYTLVGTALNNTSADMSSVFVRDQVLPNTTSTTITVATGSNTSGSVVVLAFSGMAKTGASAVVQSKFVANQAAGTPAPAFTGTTITTNPTLGFVSNVTTPATMTAPTSWTERQDVGQSSNTEGLEVVTRDSGFAGTTVTWGSSSATAFAAGVVELDASITATASPSQAAETLSSGSTTAIVATSSPSQAAETLSSGSTGAIVATSTPSQSAETLSSGSTGAVLASASPSQAAQSLSSGSTGTVLASASPSQAAQTLSSGSTGAIVATSSPSQSAQTLSSAGTVANLGVTCDLAATQSAQTVSSGSTGAVLASDQVRSRLVDGAHLRTTRTALPVIDCRTSRPPFRRSLSAAVKSFGSSAKRDSSHSM